MMRPWVRPWLDGTWVPTGTTALQMYFTDFTDHDVCGNTAYTDSALSLVADLRSSAPFGNSSGRQDHASTGYVARSQSNCFAAWMPRPRDAACRNRRPSSSRTEYTVRPASL